MQPTILVPISTDEHGALRVADTRITLDVIVSAYQQGDTPEQIHEGFPSLKLADIYAVITYYLNDREEIDEYLRQRKAADPVFFAEMTIRKAIENFKQGWADAREGRTMSREEFRRRMSNKHTIVIFYSPDDEGFIADIPDFEMCSAFGNTPKEALREVLIARDAILEDMRERKQGE